MNIKITNEQEFIEAIDTYGEKSEETARTSKELKILKQMLELYANEHKITRQNAECYRLVMKKGNAALRCQAGVTENDVVSLLNGSEIGKTYVVPTYDSAALKRDFGSTSDGHDQLAAFGLMMTNPKKHAEVTLK